MQIPVQLITPLHTMKAIDTRALIDSGASISCISWGFVRKHKLPTQRLKIPIQAWNVDNSINLKGVIWFSITLFLDIGGITRQVTFHVLSLGNENVILGLPWLKEVNPMINWVERTLSIKESLCYDFSFLFLHRLSDDSLSYWTNFSPSLTDVLRLNSASIAFCRTWLYFFLLMDVTFFLA